MNKEEITHSKSDEEEETFTEEETKEIKKIITRTMEKKRDNIITELGTYVTVASASFTISFITFEVIKKVINKWKS